MKNKKNNVRLSKIFLDVVKKSRLIEIFIVFIILYFVFSTVIFYCDRSSFHNYGDALWFTFASIYTIGYGDFTVVSLLSRIFTVILVIYAGIIIAIFTAVWANIISQLLKNRLIDSNPEEIDKLCNLDSLDKEELKQLSEKYKTRFKSYINNKDNKSIKKATPEDGSQS